MSEMLDDVRRHFEQAPVLVAEPRGDRWPEGSAFSVTDIEYLPLLYSAVRTVLREYGQSASDVPADVELHESQHLDAIDAISDMRGMDVSGRAGFKVVRHPFYSLARLYGRFSVFPYTAPRFELSPLEYASVLGHPDEPGAFDRSQLKKQGFGDVHALGLHIDEHNRRNPDAPLPLPRAYRQT